MLFNVYDNESLSTNVNYSYNQNLTTYHYLTSERDCSFQTS